MQFSQTCLWLFAGEAVLSHYKVVL